MLYFSFIISIIALGISFVTMRMILKDRKQQVK